MAGIFKIIGITVTAAMLIHAKSTARIYDVPAQVSKVENSTVQVVDSSGNVWELYADSVEVGDNVTIVIDTNGTDDIHDDSVIDMR